MKWKIIIPILCVVILLGILFVPIRLGTYDDGGTEEWQSLTYKVVKWNKISYVEGVGAGNYRSTSVYFGADRNRSIDELWELESEKIGLSKDTRSFVYTGEWLDKETAEHSEEEGRGNFVITGIFENCFFVEPVTSLPDSFKVNGTLSDDWCVGDRVLVSYSNIYYGKDSCKIECDMTDIAVSNFTPDPEVCYKPVIYLYPEEEREVTVSLSVDGGLTCTYPAYENGWNVTASPDGTLTDSRGKTYSYLYWEGETNAAWDFSRGFCVKGEDTAEFLEESLEALGLNRREANEFIVYWLPLMQENEYNVISFQTDAYTEAAKLKISPEPDTLIRVFMAYTASDTQVEIEPQELTAPERQGFCAVEWGGTEVK